MTHTTTRRSHRSGAPTIWRETTSDRIGSKVKELLEKGRKERVEMRLQLGSGRLERRS